MGQRRGLGGGRERIRERRKWEKWELWPTWDPACTWSITPGWHCWLSLVRGPGGGLELSRRHAKCGAPGPGPVSGQYCARHMGLQLVSAQMLGVDLILPRTQCGPARSQSSISQMSSRSPRCGCSVSRLPLLTSGIPIPHEPARILEVSSFPKEHLFSEASDGFLPALRLKSRP